MRTRKGFAAILAGAALTFSGIGLAWAHDKKHHHDEPPPPTTFSASDFSGTYVAAFHGSVTSGGETGTLSGNGLLTATPTSTSGGTVAGKETLNDGALGDVCSGAVSGSYAVNTDGTGTLTTTFTPDGVINVGTCATSTNHEVIVIRSDHSVSVVQTDQNLSTLGNLSFQKSLGSGPED
jgi:hypothetical protein